MYVIDNTDNSIFYDKAFNLVSAIGRINFIGKMNKSLKDLLQSEHYVSLTGEVRCSCGGYLEPPIILCAKGHGSCKKCRRRYQSCAICSEPFTDTRSIALESLVEKMQFPCTHEGCKVHVPLNQLDEHTSICPFRLTSCLMNKVYGDCTWRGRASSWLDHCVESHKNRVTDLPFVSFNDSWSPRHRDPVMRYHLLRCYEKVFNVYQIYDAKSGKMMWTVIATGNDTGNSDQFYFDLEIYNPHNSTRKISFRQPCKNENDTDILEASQNVLIPLEQIMYMLDEDRHIHINLRINKQQNADNIEKIMFEILE